MGSTATPQAGTSQPSIQAAVTNNGPEAADPDEQLGSRYVDTTGTVYIGFECGMGLR